MNLQAWIIADSGSIHATVNSAKTYTTDSHRWRLRWRCYHMADVNWPRRSSHYRNPPA